MKRIISLTALALFVASAVASAQIQAPEYKFTTVKENPITSIKNQNQSGTCWCFSTLGFLESETIRIKNIKDTTLFPDFSEMFIVGKSYEDRAVKYVRTDATIGFSAGSEAEDVLHVIEDYGLVPQSAMPGLQALPVHAELDAVTKAYVEAMAKIPNKKLSDNWQKGLSAVIDTFLGEAPSSFEYNGKTYTPATFRDEMGIVPEDYISLTSFTHHPFYKPFVVEVSDNWRWDPSYNVPLDEMMNIIYNAVEKGYTVAWGTDVSERGFTRSGLGVLLEPYKPTTGSDQERWVGKSEEEKAAAAAQKAKELPKELAVTQESRQKEYDDKSTTDDHGMQIYGIATDQNGTKYFMVKNSWGKTGKYSGIWYCSDSFVRAKTMTILVHKDAIPKDIKKKLGL